MVGAYGGRKAVVAGGLGFIGSNLARTLVAMGVEVTIVDCNLPNSGANLANVFDFKSTVNLVIGDLGEDGVAHEVVPGCDYVFNLAAQTSHIGSMLDPVNDARNNVISTLRILEACRSTSPSAVVVFASTRQVYGRPLTLPVDEQHRTAPPDVNGISKLSCEMLHRLYFQVYGVRTVNLRLTNTYGPGMWISDNRHMFLGHWIRQVLEGNPITLMGTGNQLRDLNFVTDVTRAMAMCAMNPKAYGRTMNLGSNGAISLLNLAEKLIDLKPGSEVNFIPFPDDRRAIDIGDYMADITLIRTIVKWQPRVELDEGLMATLDFYSRNWNSYVK